MSTPEAKGVHPLVEPMSMAEFFEEAKRLGVRMLGTPEETCAALDAKDAEIERLTAERDALRAALQTADRVFVESGLPLVCHAARQEIRAALAAAPAQSEMLPSADDIKELAQEAFDQVMEHAQVFASAWALVGGRFDAGNAISHAEDAKSELRTMVRSLADLAAETVRPLAAAPAPAPLTDEQIEALRCIDDCGEAAAEFSRIVRIAERAHGIGTDAAPAQHPDTADAERWRHIWQCVRMAQHGEYVLMPDEPTGLPEDSIVRAHFLREVDTAIDAARAQAQKGE